MYEKLLNFVFLCAIIGKLFKRKQIDKFNFCNMSIS